MTKIHWIAYFVIGLFVSAVSWKISYQKMVFFFYAGLAFIIVGIVKLIMSIKPGKGNEARQQKKSLSRHHYTVQNPHQTRFRRCHKCGNVTAISNRFCGKIGSQTSILEKR